MSVLLCTATGFEARACLQGVSLGVGDAEPVFEILRTGVGPEEAARALKARLADRKECPALVISTGFAGSLQSDLAVGAWVLAHETRRLGCAGTQLDPLLGEILRATLLPWQTACFLSSPAVATREGYRLLGALAEVVDMESWALREIAASAGIPFQALRMITDSPGQPLPEAIGAWSNGRAVEGFKHVARSPVEFARFVARASQFPRALSDGWREIARAWVRRPTFLAGSGSDAADLKDAG